MPFVAGAGHTVASIAEVNHVAVYATGDNDKNMEAMPVRYEPLVSVWIGE